MVELGVAIKTHVKGFDWMRMELLWKKRVKLLEEKLNKIGHPTYLMFVAGDVYQGKM
jgi:hypothetical protein